MPKLLLSVIGLLILLLWLISLPNTQALPQWNLSQQDIQRAKHILLNYKKNQDNTIHLVLTERDINIASAYLLNSYTPTQSYIQLQAEQLYFQLRFHLPEFLWIKRSIALNFSLYVHAYSTPKIQSFKLGKLSIPDQYAGNLLAYAIQHSPLQPYLQHIIKNLKALRLLSKELHITYQFPENIPSPLRNLLMPKTQWTVLQHYQKQLQISLQQHDPAWLLSLHDVLQPLFYLAYQRSVTGNPIEENRLALLVAHYYINQTQRSLFTNALHYPVYAYKRQDIARHFIASAALAISSDKQVAQLLSVEKELHDAKQKSGFSFIDLAADKAGIQFGLLATQSKQSARLLQLKMQSTSSYRDFIPKIKDLPENLSYANFKQQYPSVYGKKYQQLLQRIDQRINASPIYQ